MKNRVIITVLLFIIAPLLFSDNTDGRINVYTSILPQKFFVEKIGGDRVSVEVLVKPGKSPATYEPTPKQVIDLSKADIYFSIGVPFEKVFIPKIKSNLNNLRIIDTSEGIKKRLIEDHDHEDGVESEKHEHNAAPDPHVWLSPSAVKIQALNICNSLSDFDSENRDYYNSNMNIFTAELEEIHNELSEVLAPYRGETFFVFHPAFGYFADEFGLKQVAIETGGKEPAPSDLEKIIKKALENRVRIIFVQPEFSKKSAEAVAESIGGSVVILNTLDYDYLNNLKHIAAEIKGAF